MENGFIKGDLMQENHFFSDQVNTMIVTMISRWAKVKTCWWERCTFVRGGWGEIQVEKTSKNRKVNVRGRERKKDYRHVFKMHISHRKKIKYLSSRKKNLTQKWGGWEAWMINVCMMLLMVQIEQSTLPFCWEV